MGALGPFGSAGCRLSSWGLSCCRDWQAGAYSQRRCGRSSFAEPCLFSLTGGMDPDGIWLWVKTELVPLLGWLPSNYRLV